MFKALALVLLVDSETRMFKALAHCQWHCQCHCQWHWWHLVGYSARAPTLTMPGAGPGKTDNFKFKF